MVIPFLQWPRCPLFICFFLLCITSHFINWTLKMAFSIVSFKRKFIWKIHLTLLLKGSLAWFANYVPPYVVWSSLYLPSLAILVPTYKIQCKFDPYVFYKHTPHGQCIYHVFIENIVSIRSDHSCLRRMAHNGDEDPWRYGALRTA